MRTVPLTTLTLALLLAVAGGWWAGSAQGRESSFYKLYDIADSRGPVTHIGYAYYPVNKQLRVRAIVGGRLEAWGIYHDPQTIEHMIELIRHQPDGLFAVFDQDQLLALYRE
jgi:hypothetical protein